MNNFDFDFLIGLIGNQYGKIDIACPECGPGKKTPSNRRRKVLRIWRSDPNFLTYLCARCGLSGYARDHGAHIVIDLSKVARLKAEAAKRDTDHAARQQAKARSMWRSSRAAELTPAETYLRSRGITGDLPAALRFLPPSKPGHHPAMIAPFGMAKEVEPGRLHMTDESVAGVHLTLLRPDGFGKADAYPNKIMVGQSAGLPIMLAPPNDLLGLAITEGIEDALSVREATGLGVWAAGSASRLPALADSIPSYIDCITILVDDDDAGRKGAERLAARASEIGVHVEIKEHRRLTGEEAELGVAA